MMGMHFFFLIHSIAPFFANISPLSILIKKVCAYLDSLSRETHISLAAHWDVKN
ncbi:hypothetical protein K501DRAFT_51428, partial [Backusella circina FSU 941]